jgi:apolipoprotein N-acyltransferase
LAHPARAFVLFATDLSGGTYMASANNSNRTFAALLAFALTVILVWFGDGLNPWWPLLWFAPLPVLWFSLRSSGLSTALVAGLSWLVGSLNLWGYLRSQGTPFSVWLEVFSMVALVFALAVLLFRTLAMRGAVWAALIAFPAAWVSCEFVRNLLSVHATAGSLAYTQLKFLPFLQLASITGPWGMSFLLLLFPAALAIGLHLRKTAPKQAMQVVGATLGVIVAVLVFGAVRLALVPQQDQVKVGLIASDEPANLDVAAEGADTDRLFGSYARKAQELAARGAQVIVLPEKIGVVLDSKNNDADSIFQSLADQTKSTIVVGEVHISPPARYNQARVYAPNAPVLAYDKHHLLPPFESSLKPGISLTVIPKPSETWGVAICKDMDFTPLSRQYGRADVGLMLVPAWDFNLDRTWHGHMAVMRGVEDGFSIARAARNGYLTVSDDRGRVLAEARSDSAPFATVLAEVPVTHQTTPYLLIGDWFGWFAIAMLALTILRLYRSHD